jgi:glycine betaine/choline ABC-type transport system substrate-binding protein
MTTPDLTKLNAEFVVDKKDISAIAKEWLKTNGFV